MIFDWADVAAVGLVMRFYGAPVSFRVVSSAIEASYAGIDAHHKAIADALLEAFAAGNNEATQEAYDAGHDDGRAEAEAAYGPEIGDEWGECIV